MRSAAWSLLVGMLLVCSANTPPLWSWEPSQAADGATASKSQLAPDALQIWTIDGARHVGRATALLEGKLRLDGQSRQEFALHDIQRATCGPPPATSVEWLGQDQHDYVRVGGSKEPNGVQDIHLRLNHLPADRALEQVLIVVRYPANTKHRFRAWRLDTTRTTHWRIAVERRLRVSPEIADLYFEPDSVDAFGHEFDITLTFDDGQETKLRVSGASHTDDTLKLDASQRPEPDHGLRDLPLVKLHFTGDSILRAHLREITDEQIEVVTETGDTVEVPFVQARGLTLIPGHSAEGDQQFRAALAQPGPRDQLILLTRKNRITRIDGVLEGLNAGELSWKYEGETRQVKLDRLVGVVFARHPNRAPPQGLYQTFHFRNGDQLQARWKTIQGNHWELELPWGHSIKIRAPDVHEIDFHGGRLTYLSDLEPAHLEEVPYFGRVMHLRRDTTFTGEPLVLGGTAYRKGLAVHSRCVVTYALDGQYADFRAVLGFDPSGEGRGDVACRVLVDGKPLFERTRFRGTEPPVPVHVSVAGGEQLTLECDFGEREDIGDRVLWADARLLRVETTVPNR